MAVVVRVARVNISQEEAAILFRTLSCSTCDNPEIFGNEVLPNKMFGEMLGAISAGTLSDNCATLTATATNQGVPTTSRQAPGNI